MVSRGPILGGVFEKTFEEYGIKCIGNFAYDEDVMLEFCGIKHHVQKSGFVDSHIAALFICLSKLNKKYINRQCNLSVCHVDNRQWGSISGVFQAYGLQIGYKQNLQSYCTFEIIDRYAYDSQVDSHIKKVNDIMKDPDFDEFVNMMMPHLKIYNISQALGNYIQIRFDRLGCVSEVYQTYQYNNIGTIIKTFELIELIIQIDNIFFCDIKSDSSIIIGDINIEFLDAQIGYFDNEYVENISEKIFENRSLDRYRKPIKIATNIF